MINILFAVPSPRDIPQVLNEHPLLPVDIFVVKYKPEWDAYFEIREFFLSHKEYTHLAIACDDVVVKPVHIKKIVRDIQEHDFEVVSGMMNVFQDDLDTMNITPIENIPTPQNDTRVYSWYKKKDAVGKGIIQVGFSGFPLITIRRNIVEQIPFDSDGPWNGLSMRDRGSLDVAFCWHCHEKGIKIMADTDVIMMHLRREGVSQVFKRQPDWYFRPQGSPDVMKDWRRNKDILRGIMKKFDETGGLHNEAANAVIRAMANIILGD
jgi:hypothetical protein